MSIEAVLKSFAMEVDNQHCEEEGEIKRSMFVVVISIWDW